MNFRKANNQQLLSLAGNGAGAVVAFLSYFLLYHFLTEKEMGYWIFFQSLVALADAIRTGFLQTALIKFYAGAENSRRDEVAGSAWHLSMIISLLISAPTVVVSLVLTFYDGGITSLLMTWYGLNFLFTGPSNITTWILQAEQRFDRLFIFRILNQALFIIFLLVSAYFHPVNIQIVTYCYLFSSLICSVIPIINGWSKVATYPKKSVKCINELFRFGRFSVGTYLCSTVFKYSDLFIIKIFFGPAALAIYNLSQRILEVIEILMRSFIATAMPAMSIAFNRRDLASVAHIMKKYTGIITILLVPCIILVILLADFIVAFIGGQKYIDTEAAGILRIFMLSAILFPLDRFSGITLDIIHKPQLNLIKVIFSLVINISGDLIAIRLFEGLYGIAIASIFTLLFGAAFGYFHLARQIPIQLLSIFKTGYRETKLMLENFLKKKQVI